VGFLFMGGWVDLDRYQGVRYEKNITNRITIIADCWV